MMKKQIFFFIVLFSLFTGCKNKQQTPSEQVMFKAQQINIEGLKGALIKLQNGQTEYQFIGITSNGKDCIYFVYEGGKFNIEFEAMSEDQLPFISILTKFAEENNFKTLITTYNNQPNYPSDKPAPVLRIETNATIERAIDLGKKIQSEVFNNDDRTVYEVVP